ncbi:52 kDa repressor of the inhibitor of the protein kinase-like [Diabrotica undecimpunctata]
MDAAFCKFCALFSTVVGEQGLSAGKLVKIPFRKWKDAREDFKKHSENLYHKKCLEKAANFLATYTGEKDNIQLMLNKGRKLQIEKNRESLKPIIKTAIFLAKMGQSFRGHRDFGPFDFNAPPQRGEGNFRSLLKFRMDSGDHILTNHLKTAGQNATYISWRIQNEIISIFNTIVLENLVKRVNEAKFFSILCDETTDISGTIQLSFCARFVENYKIHEEFLQFIPVTETTGTGLAHTICSFIQDLGLNGNNIVGQGYDGASSMSGHIKGVQSVVRKEFPKAIYVHCCSHSFNLAISQGCSDSEIRNCMGTVEATYNFFNYPKRQNVLENQIDQLEQKPKVEKLKRLCATRWIQRHDSVHAFISLLPVIIKALDVITNWSDNKTATDAQLLSAAICKCDFLLSLFVVNSVFELTLLLSKYLQTENLDLRLAVESADKTKESLEQLRQNADETFTNIFGQVSALCDEFGVNMSLPRTVIYQTKRNNVPASTPEEYYRRSVFIPFFDEIIQSINDRFVAHKEILKPFQDLLSVQYDETIAKSFQSLVDFYGLDETNIKGEIILWKQFLKDFRLKPTPKMLLKLLIYATRTYSL